jgi:hypothetical protein
MPCVVLAMNTHGEYGAATTVGEFPLWVSQNGVQELCVYSAEEV